MKLKLCVVLFVLNLGCSSHSENPNSPKISTLKETEKKINRINGLKELSIIEETENYETVKNLIEKERSQLFSKDLKTDSISILFKKFLLNKIIPFWEGTEWSFEGHTSKPKSGEIACGYFVSTTLQDIGLNINRYQLAQQSPINEAKSLAVNTEVKEFSGDSLSENISAINEYLEEGIHFIGFDQSHVGYIIKEKGELYLIHSNYIDAVGVVIEYIEESEVFSFFDKFYIVKLSTNNELLSYWKSGKPIKIFKE